MEGWNPEHARELIEELNHLAWMAEEPGQSLYIWTCL
jgi:hypothetical protein